MSKQFYVYFLSTGCDLGITHILKHPDCIKGYSVRTMAVTFIGERAQVPNGLSKKKKNNKKHPYTLFNQNLVRDQLRP